MSEDTRNALNALLYNTGTASRRLMMVLATNRAEVGELLRLCGIAYTILSRRLWSACIRGRGRGEQLPGSFIQLEMEKASGLLHPTGSIIVLLVCISTSSTHVNFVL